jgi:uncharacterized protein
MWAVGRGNTEVMKILLDHGANPNLQDSEGVTALMEAVSTDHSAMIDTLISHRADPKLMDRRGRTAADIAKQQGNDEAARSLAGR